MYSVKFGFVMGSRTNGNHNAAVVGGTGQIVWLAAIMMIAAVILSLAGAGTLRTSSSSSRFGQHLAFFSVGALYRVVLTMIGMTDLSPPHRSSSDDMLQASVLHYYACHV